MGLKLFSKSTVWLGGILVCSLTTYGQLSINSSTSDIPATKDVQALLSGKGKVRAIYLKEYPVTEIQDRSLIEIITGRNAALFDTGERIIKIGTRDPKIPHGILPFEGIDAVNTSCLLAGPNEPSESAPATQQTGLVGPNQQIQFFSPDRDDLVQSQNSSVPPSRPLKPALPLKYKAVLALNFISEKKKCSSNEDYKKCLDWDRQQANSPVAYSIAEFISETSPSEALVECQRGAERLSQRLADRTPYRIQVKSLSVPRNLPKQQKLKLMELPKKPLGIGFSEVLHSWSQGDFFQMAERVVTCEARKNPNRENLDSLGSITFTFEAKKTESGEKQLENLGLITNIVSVGGRVGELPFLEFDLYRPIEDPNIEHRVFQYFSKEAPLRARNKDLAQQTAQFPTAIDFLALDKKAKTLHRMIFDFKRQKAFQQEFGDVNFDSIDDLVKNEFWTKEAKNWLSADSQIHVRPDTPNLFTCE